MCSICHQETVYSSLMGILDDSSSVKPFVPLLSLLENHSSHHGAHHDAQQSAQQQQEHLPAGERRAAEVSGRIVDVVFRGLEEADAGFDLRPVQVLLFRRVFNHQLVELHGNDVVVIRQISRSCRSPKEISSRKTNAPDVDALLPLVLVVHVDHHRQPSFGVANGEVCVMISVPELSRAAPQLRRPTVFPVVITHRPVVHHG